MAYFGNKVHESNARGSDKEREYFLIGVLEDVDIDGDHNDHGKEL